MTKRKILFLIPNLGGGGAERVFLHLLNNLDRLKFDFHLCVLRQEGPFFSELSSDVTVINLNTSLRRSLFKVADTIRNLHPDVVLSNVCFMNLITGFARMYLPNQIPLYLARESGIPSQRKLLYKNKFLRYIELLYRLSYRLFDGIICQSDDMLFDVHKMYGVPQRKLIKINNPVDIDHIQRLANDIVATKFLPDKTNLLAVGRLNQQKGFDLLLQAMALTKNKRLHLHILGEGDEYGKLRSHAEELRLSDRVTFHGFCKNPYAYMAAADVFVMTSRYEGFPNAMVEAMALGCPTVAFQCQGGLNEIIKNCMNGYSVEFGNIREFAMLLDKGDYLNLDRKLIVKDIWNRYRLDKIVKEYEYILTNVCKKDCRETG
ncbi:Glycosyltransferase involved in cell wall bisynthesis [Syntrophus gentianae]|uniref:Glycosyltransferase involved in cell wall bisynthesis n=1 Tax=Syntrophus gentianae TaxID=43775 RepID=A0A1H7X2F2_9BACT|nr:glycosyltransferase [Syntrophus gentianae]SEM27744.1 Glycosyltransferase involved in cell wall bisynthesis [Syntrophus gentianae]